MRRHRRDDNSSSPPNDDDSFDDDDNGPSLDQDGHESYELRDYNKFNKGRDVTGDKEQRRREKRDDKRRWLEQQDEMKFSHSIQFNAVPDWSSHYISYSNLKKL